jgi:hypothetical protein
LDRATVPLALPRDSRGSDPALPGSRRQFGNMP